MLKKFLSVFLIVALSTLCLSACGQKVVTSEVWVEDNSSKGTGNEYESETESGNDTTSNTTSKEESPSSKNNVTSSKKPVNSKKVFGEETSSSAKESLNEISISKNANKFTLTGKATRSSDGCKLNGTADAMSFSVKGSGEVSVNYSGTGVSTNRGGGVYYTVYYNGIRLNERLHIDGGEGTLVLKTGLPNGTHTFKLVRQTEYLATTSIVFTTVNTSGSLSPAPAKKNLTIEFIGDSITAGYGSILNDVTGFDGVTAGAPCFQDGTKTYAYLTAEKLGAEITVTAKSGIGILKNTSGTNTMPTMYSSYPTSSFTYPDKPNLIVISLGTNDKWSGVSDGDFIKEMKNFARAVRAKHPGVPIIFVGGQMITTLNNSYANIATQLGGASSGYYSYTVKRPAIAGHPVASEHEAYSNELVNFINSKDLLK